MAKREFRNNHRNICTQHFTKQFHTFIISLDLHQCYELLNPYITEASGSEIPSLAPSGVWNLPTARQKLNLKKLGWEGGRREGEQMIHRGSSAPSHPNGLEPGEVNRDQVSFPSKVVSVYLAIAQ